MCITPYKEQRVLPNFITLRWLKENGARCEDALSWFENTFPNGTTLTKALAACSNKEWIHWFLYES